MTGVWPGPSGPGPCPAALLAPAKANSGAGPVPDWAPATCGDCGRATVLSTTSTARGEVETQESTPGLTTVAVVPAFGVTAERGSAFGCGERGLGLACGVPAPPRDAGVSCK